MHARRSPRTQHTDVPATVVEGFRSLLVPVDLTPAADRVLARVAELPLAPHAHVTLLHVISDDLPAPVRRRMAHDAKEAMAHERSALHGKLPHGTKIESVVAEGASAAEIATHAGETNAELVVMGRGGGNLLRDLFLGSTAERVIRQARVPVLAVRRPAHGPYQHPALALDAGDAPPDVMTMLLRLLPPPRPMLTVVHAYDIPLRGRLYPSLAEEEADAVRDQFREDALVGLERQLLGLQAHAADQMADVPGWRIQARTGSARSVIMRTVKQERTDVLGLATHGYRGLAHAFLGTVAGDVLRHVSCDVLVVPPREHV